MVEQVKTKSEPHVRFRGFDDEWELRKLGEVVGEIQSGNRLPKDSLTNGDVPYVVAQTKNNGVFKKIARGTLDYNGNPMKLFPGNSISFSIDNPEAMFYRNAEFYTSNIMRVIHKDHLTHEQYVFILENMKRFIRGYDWSRKFSGPVVSNLEYLQPSEEEQQKIGELFQTVDKTIDLSNTQVENLKQQKKALLQRLFPKKGETEPKVRLRGFTDEWNEVKLGDLVDTSTGKLNANAMTDDGAYPFFTCAKDVYLTDTYSFDDEALIIAGNGDMGAVKYYNGKFDAYQRTYVLTEIKGDAKYLEYCLSVNLPRQIHLMTYGSTMPYITKSTLTDMVIRIPSLPEQQAIGELFRTLDEQIRLAEDKVSQYKELKQALLQRLFV